MSLTGTTREEIESSVLDFCRETGQSGMLALIEFEVGEPTYHKLAYEPFVGLTVDGIPPPVEWCRDFLSAHGVAQLPPTLH